MEIMGLFIENKEIIGACIGSVIGALLTAFTCYVVGKVKHDYVVKDEANAAALKGEEIPSWRIEKSDTWYKGYKLALVTLFVLATVLAMATCLVVKQYGYAAGAIECGAVGFFAAILEGLVVDKKIVHPIANGKFMEEVETPIVDAFLHPAPDVPTDDEEIDPSVIAIAKQLRDKGLI